MDRVRSLVHVEILKCNGGGYSVGIMHSGGGQFPDCWYRERKADANKLASSIVRRIAADHTAQNDVAVILMQSALRASLACVSS